MAPLPITSLFVAAFAVALVALSIPVTLRRIKVGAPEGPGTDETLQRRIRAQGNFTEYAPMGLIALALVEGSGAPCWMVVALGATLTIGRAFHAAGMLAGKVPLRAVGMVCTYLMLLGATAWLVVKVLLG